MRKITMKKLSVLVVFVLMLSIFVTGCSKKAEEAPAAEPAVTEEAETEAPAAEEEEEVAEEVPVEETTILIAAAASLENVFVDKLIPMFEEANPGIKVEGTYDASGKLQTQIEEGMEADVFFSAAEKQMNALTEGGFINTDTRIDLLENKIVLIVPSNSELEIIKFEDIVKADTIAIGDPESVPVGQYSQEVLENLGLWEEVLAKASLGTNVTEVLNWVGEGSAQAGIVYATDAASIADKLNIIGEAPEGSLEKPVIYPVAATEKSANPDAAKKLVDFLATDAAIAEFEAYGFSSNLK